MKQEESIHISLLEKVIVNFALPSDFIYHTIKSTVTNDEYSYQTPKERVKEMWSGKINKYQQLLEMKQKHGYIPEMAKDICKDSPCGRVRLALTYLR